MKKTTLAAQGGAGILALALIAGVTTADSVKYNDISALNINMPDAAMTATGMVPGKIVEAELELEDGRAIWEVEIVDESRQVVSIEIDGMTGEIISNKIDDDDDDDYRAVAVTLSQALELIDAEISGTLVEAELEHESGTSVWEVEAIDKNDHELKFRIHAETGELLK